MSYDNTNTGLISKNDKKTTDSHPDIKGQCDIDGVQFWVAGWMKKRKDGSGSFYSLKFDRKEAAPQKAAPAQRQAPATTGGFADMDDDIPFRDPMANRAFAMSI